MSLNDSSGRKRRRTPSPEESRREDRHKRKRSRKRENRGENNSSVNETLTKVLTSMDDIKKEYVAWTTRVSVIENDQLNQNSSVYQFTRRLHL
jgi:hypothetical protein